MKIISDDYNILKLKIHKGALRSLAPSALSDYYGTDDNTEKTRREANENKRNAPARLR